MVDVKEAWCWVTGSLTKDRACTSSSSMTFEDLVVGSEEFSQCVEFAGDMVNYVRFHVSLIISKHINYPPLPRLRTPFS